jgi:hypothetical protein
MILDIPTGRKYITRMDYPDTHGWWVRILINRQGNGRVSKFFGDAKYSSKEEGLSEAIKFRDKHFKHLVRSQKIMKTNKPRLGKIYSTGIYYAWIGRNNYKYLYICTSWMENGKQHQKMFSVFKYGEDKAYALAEKIRAEKTKHKIRAY